MKALLETQLIPFLIKCLDGENSTIILRKLKEISVSDDVKITEVLFLKTYNYFSYSSNAKFLIILID